MFSPPPPAAGVPAKPSVRRRRLARVICVLALGAGLFAAGAVVLNPAGSARPGDAGPVSAAGDARPHDSLGRRVSALQERLRRLPRDAGGWAELGMDYVQQAKNTADPSYYPKAQRALDRSLGLERRDNYAAQTGMAALCAARHDFTAALAWSRKAVATNPYSAAAHGVLGDALTQLGRYKESFQAVQDMVDLQPSAASLARASYSWELRGDTAEAEALMRRALNDSGSTADAAFARYHLAELAFNEGDPAAARREAEAGLRDDPGNPSLLEIRARAAAAMGNTAQAVRDYTDAIARVPQPEYVIALGELQQSLGRTEEARQQYELYRAQERLFQGAGVSLDSDGTLFEADHGDPAEAVELGLRGLRARPFMATQDAYAWALHRAGHDREALTWADKALALGTRNALFLYHRGVIHQALGNPDAARADLRRALRINPHFDILHPSAARSALARIGQES
ncbi:tetratricopeptide repeat protein [Streptomyces sp. NPDC002659]|uniref:tetratricopeptide repeat protein n=1 Tax=Streptomyces sp. NPDC002659 TaxID=3364656 RepID=UPI00368933CC